MPLAASRSMAVPVVQLAGAAVMTASGAGLVLAASPSVSGRVIFVRLMMRRNCCGKGAKEKRPSREYSC